MDAIKNKAKVHVNYYCALLFSTRKLVWYTRTAQIFIFNLANYTSLYRLLTEHKELNFAILAVVKKKVETSHLGCLSNRQHGATLEENTLYLKNMSTIIWNNASSTRFWFSHLLV